jgi:hypothetical protein
MANTAIRLGYIAVSSGGGGGGGGGFEEFSDVTAFPPIGVSEVIYLALDTKKIYRWNGVSYTEISPSDVTSVNDMSGAVVLDKIDIGLGNVDNTSDINKPISSATQTALDGLDERVTPIEEILDVTTVYAYENNAAVYADGEAGIKDPSALIRDGWYFKNSVAGQKINWYYFDGTSQGNVTLGDFKSAYAVMTFDAVSGAAAPILAVYTFPTGTGDVIPGFAHSRIVYDGAMIPTPEVGKQYLVYAGENPPVFPQLPRINLPNIPSLSIGDKLPTEQILTVSFGSSSGAGVDQVQYMVETLGLFSDPVKHELDLRIRVASQLELDTHEADFTNPHQVTKDQVGLGNVDNTSDLDKPISDDTQDALDLKYDASNPAGYVTATEIGELEGKLKYNQVVYVDKSNTGTYTADGSLTKPYKSIEAMYNAITDASASKRYACVIAPGTYVEASTIRIKGWIDLTAFATDTVGISVTGGETLKWSNNSPGRVFVKDIGFTSGLEVLNDNPTGTSGIVFDLDNVDAPSLIFRGRGGGRDFIQLRNDTRIASSCTIQSAATTIFDSTNISNLTMNDVGCVFPDSFGSAITASLRSNYIGSISITATTFDVYTDAWGTIVAGNLNIVSNSPSFPCYFNFDATSYPLGTITLTGSNPAQLVPTSVAQAIRYTPATSANWAAPAPVEVKAALDSLAANKISSTEKGAANGVAPLDSSAKIDALYLPSYVDDVLEFANLAAFPNPGETGKIYIALDTNVTYRWSGSTYIQITSGAVASVNGQTGIVVLDSDDLNHEQAVPAYWDVADNSTVKAHIDELAARREAQNTLTKEPTGFATRTESDITFSDSTPDRTFTISPVGASFTFYVKGVKYVKTTAETLQIPNSDGNHIIFYTEAGVLSSSQAYTPESFKDNALVAIVYWNTETSTHSYFAEERHGLQMDGETHSYLHNVLGAQYLSGLALQGFVVDGNGSLATHAQFTGDSGVIRDEDLVLAIPAQTEIPVLYRQGTLWRKKAADAFPMIYSGTTGYTGANGRIPYNQLISGSWQLTEVINNDFVLVHIFATNDKETPIVGIQGITNYISIAAARIGASTEITSLSGLPFAEFVALGSVVLQTSNTYTNTPKARTRSINGGDYVDFRGTQLYTPAGVATSHALLSGLSGDDHIQYHTDARGDIRYYTKSQVDSLIGSGGSPGDISEQSYSFSNSQIVPESITGLAFSNAVVRSFNATVSIAIDADADLFEVVEINGIQKGSEWDIAISSTGDITNISFSITNAGQVQYVSANYTGFVTGVMKFKAVTTSV